MKLRVQHENGSIETINLSDILVVREGRHLNRIADANGCEYFFTHDGLYDGWGASGQMTEAEAAAILNAMERKREIFNPEDEHHCSAETGH
jgi:hypothetical protein